MGSVEKRTRTLASGKSKTFWIARWREPSGRQATKSFPTKTLATDHLTNAEADILRGDYIPADAGKVTFQQYATKWLASQTFDPSSREAVALRLRLHVYPVLGELPLSSIKPSTVQGWQRGLTTLAESTRRLVFANVSTVFAAAVDDEVIRKNPCKARSVTRPKAATKRVVPWEPERMLSVQRALPARYRVVVTLGFGLGLRQGEVFGLSLDDFDVPRRRVVVRRQVKLLHGRQVFAPPKFGKIREVPLPQSVADELADYIVRFQRREVALPWKELDGPSTTVPLILTSRESRAINRNYFNPYIWKPALLAADVPATRENGCHMLRHVYASTLLHEGESIKALSEYLGHADPGFTLRVYTHLMPGSDERTRGAIDKVLCN